MSHAHVSHARSHESHSSSLTILFLTLLTVLALAAPVWGGDEMTLRVNDVKGEPGGLIAVEVRTYAPRGVGQGQICLSAASRLSTSGSGSFAGPSAERFDGDLAEGFRSRDPAPAQDLTPTSALRSAVGAAISDSADQPLLTLEGVVVLSGLGDAVYDSFFDAGTQLAMVDFTSDSGTINEADGPMLVLYFRLSEHLEPDQEFEIRLDSANTFIVDDKGEQVPLELRGGRLRIAAPNDSCRY